MPWEPFSTIPQMPGHHSSMGLTYARPNRVWIRWKYPWLPTPYRTYKYHFQVVLQKEKQNLSIAARHLGLSAHPAPGGEEAGRGSSVLRAGRGLEPRVALKHQVGPQILWISMGKGPQKLFWINLLASINEPGSWSDQTGDYLMGISTDVM